MDVVIKCFALFYIIIVLLVALAISSVIVTKSTIDTINSPAVQAPV